MMKEHHRAIASLLGSMKPRIPKGVPFVLATIGQDCAGDNLAVDGHHSVIRNGLQEFAQISCSQHDQSLEACQVPPHM